MDCTKHLSIAPEVKLLSTLKHFAYGTVANAFVDYFQMGESTTLLAIKKVASGIRNNMHVLFCIT